EDCRVFTLQRLARPGVLIAGTTGTLRWHPGNTASFEILAGAGDSLVLRLRYEAQTAAPLAILLAAVTEPAAEELTILLRTSRGPRGRPKWWADCPLATGGRSGGRRRLPVYLPPRARYCGCRVCHRLSYTSSQRSHCTPDLAAVLR